MKRYGNLYDTIISVENLRLADERLEKERQNLMEYAFLIKIKKIISRDFTLF